MEKYYIEFMGCQRAPEIIEAGSHAEASKRITAKYGNVSRSIMLLADYEKEQNPPKMYKVEIEKRTGDNLADFLTWAETYMESPKEVPNTSETIGRFCLDYMGKELDFIPALFVEDSNGNIIEYYVFKDSETLRHEKPEEITETSADYCPESDITYIMETTTRCGRPVKRSVWAGMRENRTRKRTRTLGGN